MGGNTSKYSVKEVSEQEWDNLVTKSPQGTIFSETRWMKLFDVPFKMYGVYKGNELIGGIGGFSKPMPLTPFQGILVKEDESMAYVSIASRQIEVTKALLGVCPDNFYNHYTFPDIRPFKWAGNWQIDVKYTYVVDDKWGRLDKDIRNSIKGKEVFPGDMGIFCDLYEERFKQKGIPMPVNHDFLVRFAYATDPEIYSSQTGKTMVVMIKDSKRSYYILGASTESNQTPEVLWIAIKQQGGEVDLCGANGESIAFYKRGFGGILTPYYGVKRNV